MGTKVLLIYLTPFKITGLPAGVASLCAVLKNSGHKVKVFDTAFYPSGEEDQAKIRAERLVSKRVDSENKYLMANESDIEEDLINVITAYNPDIIGFSILEIMYETGIRLTRLIKDKFSNIPIVAGGVFPTLSSDIVLKEDSIDMLCVGEGEKVILEICNRIENNMSLVDIEGLYVKRDGKMYKNRPAALNDLDELPHPDYTEFDNRLFYKPMQGRMYKMVNIETSRGCAFSCTFCAAPELRKFFKEGGCGQYYRIMDMNKIIEQIYFQVKKHNPEFIYFSSENFLAMDEEKLDMFVDRYKKIKIPFWFQARIETIAEKRIKELKQIGMRWMTVGLEHGNEDFRNRFLKRKYSNKIFIEKMGILKNLGLGASINNMVGFPFETRDLIFDTIRMNKELWEQNPRLESNVFLFTPFRGCALFDVCIKNGMLSEKDSISSSNMSDESVINFSEDFRKDLRGLIRTFNLYVRLPGKYYGDIKIAEKSDEKGNLMFKKLKDLVKTSSQLILS